MVFGIYELGNIIIMTKKKENKKFHKNKENLILTFPSSLWYLHCTAVFKAIGASPWGISKCKLVPGVNT